MIITSAPGKLFIAGEYAVTKPGYPAILVAVDKFITVSLKKALGKGSIILKNNRSILWTRDKNEMVFAKYDNRISYIMSAINIVETYAKELGRRPDFYHLRIDSQLESKEGKKYGLGSSAAVIVATVDALCKYYEISVSTNELFKLSAIANLDINSNGSCGDIAASVFGGWIAFTSFDKDWVLDKQKNNSIKELLSEKWPSLYVESLTPPKELELMVGWTGEPASTIRLLDYIYQNKLENRIAYNKFLEDSKKCVTKMIKAFKEHTIEEIQKQIQINRELLVNLGNDLGVIIETPLLTKLCDIGLKFNGYGKPSGAGGGDCGIVIFNNDKFFPQLIDEWKKWGITYLPLNVTLNVTPGTNLRTY